MKPVNSEAPPRGSPPASGPRTHLRAKLPDPGHLGAELNGLDVRDVDAGLAAEIRQLVYEQKLVVLHGQDLSDAEYVAFARVLGEPQIYFQHHYHHPDHPEIFVSSNVPMDGKKVGVAGTGRYWHSDYQFFPEPLPLTMVTPMQIPSQGDRATQYIDMERVLVGLPERFRPFVEGTRCLHEAKWRYKVQPFDIDKSITEILEEFGAETPTVSHPTVITHPVTGAKCLYVSRGFTRAFEGLSHEESEAVMADLFEYIEQDEHVHTVNWVKGDILLWDNRQLIHQGRNKPTGEASVSYRIGVYDGLRFTADEPHGRLAE